MTFQMYQEVILTDELPAENLRAGDVGVVVDHHEAANGEAGLSVEFFDMTGQTVAVVTVPTTMLRLPTQTDLPAVRIRRSA